LVKIGNIEFSNYPVILAPMEDITDPPFRHLCKKFGADLMYTEFISSEGLIRDAAKSRKKLDFDEDERPIGIQIFGHNAESMKRAAEKAQEAKPDLIDINWGCPVKKVVSKGAGAGMLRDIPKMESITREVVKATHLPVTIKTRLGWDEENKNIVEIAERLQDTGIAAISIHGRTKVQLYRGKADWTLIGAVKNNPRMHIPVIGNGDITGPEIALEMKNRYSVDGIMVGRAIVGNPWILREIKHYLSTEKILPPPTLYERIDSCKLHLQKSIEWKGERTAVFEMRTHYGKYFKALPDFKPFKLKLYSLEDHLEVMKLLDEILVHYS